MAEVIIAGIGNPYRGDDGAGWAVIDALKKQRVDWPLSKLRGEITELLDLFSGYNTVFLVDACFSSSPIGTWSRINASQEALPDETSQTSTHGLGIAQAIALAKNLNMLPEKLIIYAIVGDKFNISDTLSPAVEQAVDLVATALLKENVL